jgi:hypothetical protein
MNTFFDIHMWPSEGRILILNQAGFGIDMPVLTFLSVGVPDAEQVSLRDTVVVTAMALVGAGNPTGDLFEHMPNGSIVQLNPVSLASLAILREAH